MTAKEIELQIELNNANKEIKSLRANVSLLNMEKKGLIKRIDRAERKYEELEESIDERINKTVSLAIAKLTEDFKKVILEKDQKIENLSNEVDRLRGKINKDSSNSSKPPSSNGFKKVIQNNREQSDKKMGGQKGHEGKTLTLPSNVNELIEDGELEYKIVEHKISEVLYSAEYIVKYELDIEMKATLYEHRFYNEINPITKTLTEPEIPEHLMNPVNYGLNLKSLSVILSNEGLIANDRLAEFFKVATNGIIKMSPTTVIANNKLFSRKLSDLDQLTIIENNLLNGPVICSDDTGITTTQIREAEKDEREDRKVFQGCLRVYSNELNTRFTFNSRKDEAGLKRDNLLNRYQGFQSHDHENKYRKYGDDSKHADCHSHCNRELKGIYENLKTSWAIELRKFFNKLNVEKENLITKDINEMTPERLHQINQEFDVIIKKGWQQIKLLKNQFGWNDAFNMLVRMEDFKKAYLLFVRNFEVPYTNNLAERDLRHGVTKEKISGALRSFEGGLIYADNYSFISTIKKRKLDLFKSIRSIFRNEGILKSELLDISEVI